MTVPLQLFPGSEMELVYSLLNQIHRDSNETIFSQSLPGFPSWWLVEIHE